MGFEGTKGLVLKRDAGFFFVLKLFLSHLACIKSVAVSGIDNSRCVFCTVGIQAFWSSEGSERSSPGGLK